MSRSLQRADDCWADLTRQVDWYRDEASPEVAERFVDAVEATLSVLAEQPGLGRARFRNWPELEGIRSFRVQRPFHRFLIFYYRRRCLVDINVAQGANCFVRPTGHLA